MNKTECFKLKVSSLEGNLESFGHLCMLSLNGGVQDILRMDCNKYFGFPNPANIIADPFLFVYNNRLYLFYEYKQLNQKADIRMRSTSDLLHWTEPKVVLSESKHLSFPNVFTYNNRVYMVPECSAFEEIRLYEASKPDLSEFKLVSTLLRDDVSQRFISFSDTEIIQYDGYYYLFTTVNSGKSNELRLYYSKEIIGPWQQHPMSPISKDQRYSRNGGKIMKIEDKIIRVAQDCSEGYGDNIHFLCIETISPLKYAESVIKSDFFDRDNEYYRFGGHQFSMVKYGEKMVIATDAKEYHYFVANRFLNKLIQIFHGE